MINFLEIINPKKTRVNHGGNYCGHDKYNPCLALALPSDNRPPFLYSAGEAFKQYFDRPQMIPTLNHSASTRQQRTERREAVIITGLALLEFVDLASLRVGIPTENGFQPLKLEVLRRRTHLGQRRFERAIQSLRESGILSVSDQYKFRNASGNYVFFPAVRRISQGFFDALGMGRLLLEERLAASKRLKQKAERAGIRLAQVVKYSLSATAEKYRQWREKRQEAINVNLTRDDKARVEELTRLFMTADGLGFEDARRRALEVRARAARKRRRESALQKSAEEGRTSG